MNPVSPDPSVPTAQPTSEAWALRGEWREEPPSLAREEAGRALEALAKAAGETAGATATDELPPVPEELRSRWAEAYGRPVEAATPTKPERPPADDRRAEGFADWLGSLFHPRRAAWVGGAGVAMAAVVVLLSQHDTGPAATTLTNSGTRLRGTGAAAVGDPAPVAVIAPASAMAARDAVVTVVRQAFPGRDVRVLASAHEAAAIAQSEPRLVVVNLGSGLVTAWAGGKLADEFPVPAGSDAARVVGQIESADELLEKSAAAP